MNTTAQHAEYRAGLLKSYRAMRHAYMVSARFGFKVDRAAQVIQARYWHRQIMGMLGAV